MKIGSRSVLYGAHCFFIHPLFVALAWWRLYGFPFDYRLWVAFFVHDLGYWGCENMDGEEGEQHPYLGAFLMSRFDEPFPYNGDAPGNLTWYNFTLYHSRFLARHHDRVFSKLCVADKLAAALEPRWFYLLRVIVTGEIKEYMALHQDPNSKYGPKSRVLNTRWEWCTYMQNFCRRWAYAHKDIA